jgi:MFS family permease
MRGRSQRADRLSSTQVGVLVAAGVANALIFLDQTAVVVALPAIRHEFHSSTVALQWTIGAYLLSFAALVSCSGRLADLYGRRRLFLIGLTVFGLSSVMCAVAPSQLVLIIARLLQGAGAAFVQPLVLAHATGVVPAGRRGWAIWGGRRRRHQLSGVRTLAGRGGG